MMGAAFAEGDPEYGQYLSSECVTCHQSSVTGTIPAIAGMNEDGFIALMKLYRSKQLNNPTMQTVAMRLSDEDIAALAAYFSALKAPD
ncbi:c-type cytochrome [Anderseniella sp. Alg231-50]|uniref:c-type cytochrome n=1 Tax=Anderseniella sp. Alg231-50 TaxID=1922226 RepID=UPI00307C5034